MRNKRRNVGAAEDFLTERKDHASGEPGKYSVNLIAGEEKGRDEEVSAAAGQQRRLPLGCAVSLPEMNRTGCHIKPGGVWCAGLGVPTTGCPHPGAMRSCRWVNWLCQARRSAMLLSGRGGLAGDGLGREVASLCGQGLIKVAGLLCRAVNHPLSPQIWRDEAARVLSNRASHIQNSTSNL
jgi:hypothetical protein